MCGSLTFAILLGVSSHTDWASPVSHSLHVQFYKRMLHTRWYTFAFVFDCCVFNKNRNSKYWRNTQEKSLMLAVSCFPVNLLSFPSPYASMWILWRRERFKMAFFITSNPPSSLMLFVLKIRWYFIYLVKYKTCAIMIHNNDMSRKPVIGVTSCTIPITLSRLKPN